MWGKPEPACVTMAEAQMPTAQTDHVSANRTLPRIPRFSLRVLHAKHPIDIYPYFFPASYPYIIVFLLLQLSGPDSTVVNRGSSQAS
jgi:hypothetical protein